MKTFSGIKISLFLLLTTYFPLTQAQDYVPIEIQHVTASQMRSLVEKFPKRLLRGAKFDTTPVPCNKSVCSVTLTITYDPKSKTCLIVPDPYQYNVSNPALILWSIISNGFRFNQTTPVLFNDTAYPNDKTTDLFDPALSVGNLFAVTFDLDAKKNKEIHYYFQIDRQKKSGDFVSCDLADPVIYNM